MTDEINYLTQVTQSCYPTKCHQYAFLFILQVASTWSCSWDLAAQVVVVYQVLELKLASDLLVVLPPLEWKCMS